jgi:osmotically inducible protein OsmC
MSVASILDKKGLTPDKLDTNAILTLEGLVITAIHLSIAGSVKGIDADAFAVVVKEAEQNCIVSKALKVAITSDTKLHSSV